MKVLAIPASNSRAGLNRQIIGYAAQVLEQSPGTTVDIVDLNDYEMPIFSVERMEGDGIPEPAMRFYNQITEADAVVVSFAEHNGSYSVAWKNVYDWASRHDMGVFQGRKTALFSTSPGPRGGQGVLEHASMVFPFFGAEVVGALSIPQFGENFDTATGVISNDDLKNEFVDILSRLG